MDYPYFVFDPSKFYGQDIYFFNKLHETYPELKIYCDPSVLCQHISQMLIPLDISGLNFDNNFDVKEYNKMRREYFDFPIGSK